MKRKVEPPESKAPEPGTWKPRITATNMMPFGRYEIELTHPGHWSSITIRSEGGWLAYTLAGAIRKGERIAARQNRGELKLAERTALIEEAGA